MLAGVDGCRGGWVVAHSAAWPCPEHPRLAFHDSFAGVLAGTAACDIVVVDMPIGLPGDPPRPCDGRAREMLGRNGASVFPAPPRSALDATTPRQFQNRFRRARGVGAPVPLWGIVPKIVDVDRAMTPAHQRRVMEFHPELAWRRRGGALPSKRTPEGLRARTRLLAPHVPGLDSRVPPEVVGRARLDDVLDAIVGIAVAADIAAGRVHRIPETDPPVDARGLRMEIWY